MLLSLLKQGGRGRKQERGRDGKWQRERDKGDRDRLKMIANLFDMILIIRRENKLREE